MRLDQALSHLLDTAEASLATPPGRAYVAHGQPAGDLCEELVVWAQLITPATAPAPGRSCTALHRITAAVDLTRPHPRQEGTDRPPAAGVLDTAGRALSAEAWDLWTGLTQAWLDCTLLPGLTCDQVRFQRAEPLGPQGGFATWRVTLDFPLIPDPQEMPS